MSTSPFFAVTGEQDYENLSYSLAKSLKLKPTQVKTGIAKYRGLETIDVYKDAMKRHAHSPTVLAKELKRFDDNIAQEVMAAASVTNENDLAMEHWEAAENNLESSAEYLANSPELAQAIAALKAIGLDQTAGQIMEIARNSKTLTYLKATVQTLSRWAQTCP